MKGDISQKTAVNEKGNKNKIIIIILILFVVAGAIYLLVPFFKMNQEQIAKDNIKKNAENLAQKRMEESIKWLDSQKQNLTQGEVQEYRNKMGIELKEASKKLSVPTDAEKQKALDFLNS